MAQDGNYKDDRQKDDSQKDDRMNPDMDQILASIRRVIAEDGESPGGGSSDVERVTPVAASTARPAPTLPSARPPTPTSTPTPTPRPMPPMRERPPVKTPAGGVPGLLTPESRRTAETAFENLAEGRASAHPAEDAAFRAMVESVLIPLLREWLNRNMPRMVERIVQEEIDRITKSL